MPHDDPDGLAAGAILTESTRGGVLHVETPWEGALPADRPVVVAGWGVRPLVGGGAALYVDHHAEPEAGRLRGGPVPIAFELLRGSADAKAALARPQARELEEARAEVESHRRAAMRVGPRVGPRAALVSLDVPARVHSQVAAAWTRRLSPRIVVVANAGWRPGRVSFSVRSAEQIDLRAWLREIYSPPPGAGDYGRGHARATGGSLVPQAFEEFAAALLT